MNAWPLHVTLADVFTIECSANDIDNKLAELLSKTIPVTTQPLNEATLGTTPVILLEKNVQLIALHEKIIDYLETNGAVFSTPEFNREGFLPHCTIQPSAQIAKNRPITIDSVSLVDMFPNEDWQQRKVLATFKLKKI